MPKDEREEAPSPLVKQLDDEHAQQFQSRSQEKRIRTMRGDKNPLSPTQEGPSKKTVT